MNETLKRFALESLADSFEMMAFLSPAPVEGTPAAPADAVLLTIRFDGDLSGTVEMIAPRALGTLAVANMLGDNAPSSTRCEDVLKELLNIVGGLMLRRCATASYQQITMSLPSASAFDPGEWPSFVASPAATVLDVEGNLVGLRVCATDRIESERCPA